MSGKPSKGMALEVIGLVQEIDSLQAEEYNLHEKTRRLKALGQKRAGLQRDLHQLLEGADCDARGNYGWEGRFSWLVAEIVKQTPKVPAPEAPCVLEEGITLRGAFIAIKGFTYPPASDESVKMAHFVANEMIKKIDEEEMERTVEEEAADETDCGEGNE